MLFKLILLLMLVALCGCSDADKTVQVLQSQGFKDVKITGYNFFGCGQDDIYHTGFVATGQNGMRVKGTVCSGVFFKGSTVRFE